MLIKFVFLLGLTLSIFTSETILAEESQITEEAPKADFDVGEEDEETIEGKDKKEDFVIENEEKLEKKESEDLLYLNYAQIILINKVYAKTQHLNLKINQSFFAEEFSILAKSCVRTSTNKAKDRLLLEITNYKTKEKVFFGWVFADSPSIYGLENPMYDIIFAQCNE